MVSDTFNKIAFTLRLIHITITPINAEKGSGLFEIVLQRREVQSTVRHVI